MPSSSFVVRAGALIAAAAIVSSLMACSAEPELKFVSPTMAPVQTIVEACAITGEEVDRLTLETEQRFRDALDQARADIAAGQMPSTDALSGTLGETLTEIEKQISNAEVLTAITQLREAAQGFRDIAQPESALAVPGYLGSLGSQLNELAQAGKQLKTLCSDT